MIQARNNDDPYEQAIHDPSFLAAVDAAHRGRWAALDALWWLDHPADATPGGRPSPEAELRVLQRRLFAEDGDAAGDHAVAQAVHERERQIEAERAAIEQALAAVRLGRPVPPDGTGPADARPEAQSADPPDAGIDGGAEDDDPASDLLPVSAAPDVPASSRRRIRLVIGLAAAVLLGVALGSAVGAGGQLDGVLAGATPSATPTPRATPEKPMPVLAAQVFARPPTDRDTPRVTMPASFAPGSFRYLGSAGWTDADGDGLTDQPYYAARGSENMMCLVLVPEDGGYLSTCAPESDYPSTGLRLTWESTSILREPPDGSPPMVLDITVAWHPDSTIETRGSGRVVSP